MLILDTHAWIWYVTESSKLGNKAKKKIDSADICGVSAISCWEIAMLVEKGRIEFNMPIETWIHLALDYKKIKLIELLPKIAIMASKFGNSFHGDPADRIITATAIHTNSILITKDSKIAQSKLVETVW